MQRERREGKGGGGGKEVCTRGEEAEAEGGVGEAKGLRKAMK